jgi:hypothetical protein
MTVTFRKWRRVRRRGTRPWVTSCHSRAGRLRRGGAAGIADAEKAAIAEPGESAGDLGQALGAIGIALLLDIAAEPSDGRGPMSGFGIAPKPFFWIVGEGRVGEEHARRLHGRGSRRSGAPSWPIRTGSTSKPSITGA